MNRKEKSLVYPIYCEVPLLFLENSLNSYSVLLLLYCWFYCVHSGCGKYLLYAYNIFVSTTVILGVAGVKVVDDDETKREKASILLVHHETKGSEIGRERIISIFHFTWIYMKLTVEGKTGPSTTWEWKWTGEDRPCGDDDSIVAMETMMVKPHSRVTARIFKITEWKPSAQRER